MDLVGFTNLNNSNNSSNKCNVAYIVLVKFNPLRTWVCYKAERGFQPAFHLDGGGKKAE